MNWKDIFNGDYDLRPHGDDVGSYGRDAFALFVLNATKYPYFSFRGKIYKVKKGRDDYEETPYTVHDIH